MPSTAAVHGDSAHPAHGPRPQAWTRSPLPATGARASLGLATALLGVCLQAAGPEAHPDETRVPAYTLPDPLVTDAGERIAGSNEWIQVRRPELLGHFQRAMYGTPLPTPSAPRWVELAVDPNALGGRATRRDVALELDAPRAGRALRFTVYVPNSPLSGPPVPAFAGLHLFDTAKAHPEPAVSRRLRPGPGTETPAPSPSAPPGQVGRDTADRILARGYALISLDLPDLAPDSATNWWKGALRLHGRDHGGPPGPGETGALGVWAWGLSRVIDYAATTRDLDPTRIMAVGHSRMGKAALWAGAVDTRFAAVISNDSGCGGAALSRRIFGETVAIITRAFPHWFTAGFAAFAGRESELPVDQHELLALIAPRPLFVASASEDAWADPRGEFLSAWHASSVYRLMGVPGLDPAATNMPPVDEPVGGVLRYHLRGGQHDLTDIDWNAYLAFADHHIRAGPGSAGATRSGPGRADWKGLMRHPDAWFASPDGKRITDGILTHQTPRGDWPKNIDTTLPPAGPPSGEPARGTFDNGATVHELRFLARASRVTGDPRAADAVVRGMRQVLEAQMPSGGWPQSHPPGNGYARHITFNDDTMVNLLELVRDAARTPDFAWIEAALRQRAAAAFDRGIACILRCQVRNGDTLAVWGAQHDATTLAPAPARTFEPASLTGAESARILHLLMSLDPPPPGAAAAIRAGAAWFEKVRIPGIRQVRVDGDKRIVPDPDAPALWSRFYELGTDRPIFCGRDGVVRYQISEIEAERRNGYAWYGDWGAAVAREFGRWQARHPGAAP